jgi:hypothetical protein
MVAFANGSPDRVQFNCEFPASVHEIDRR